ncbi:MAG: carboxypeptidase-like regulatory domain-containing protein [Candidatus Micrarchaeota archaeon]|nr:carboxypeptidase-like regulatory domain-containing protein [Candidatus Micrarchaeota archaeon]
MREKIISIAFLLAIVLVAGCIEKEVQSLQGEPLQKTAGSVHGTVIGARNATLENARVTLISLNGSANYSAITGKNGKFNITDVPDGAYGVAVQKEGYRNNAPSPFLIFSGYSYDLNISLVRDCFYYSVNTTTDYAVRYGYNGTVYRGDITFIVPYPDGAAYSISPDAKNGLSGTDTIYKAGNRMLEWTLNNSKGTGRRKCGSLMQKGRGLRMRQPPSQAILAAK